MPNPPRRWPRRRRRPYGGAMWRGLGGKPTGEPPQGKPPPIVEGRLEPPPLGERQRPPEADDEA